MNKSNTSKGSNQAQKLGKLENLRPNLKNLSRGLNLSRGSNMVGSTKNCIQFFKIQAGAQL